MSTVRDQHFVSSAPTWSDPLWEMDELFDSAWGGALPASRAALPPYGSSQSTLSRRYRAAAANAKKGASA